MTTDYLRMTEIEREIYRQEMAEKIKPDAHFPNKVNFHLTNGGIVTIEHAEDKLILTIERSNGHLSIYPKFANRIEVMAF